MSGNIFSERQLITTKQSSETEHPTNSQTWCWCAIVWECLLCFVEPGWLPEIKGALK